MNDRLDILPIHTWLPARAEPLLISGPCSAESREQVMATAAQLSRTGLVEVFRAGIWKPRSRPSGFRGAGEEALQWLREVRQQYHLKTAVEVATPQHVELALKYGVDILWLGARTVVNPFSVEEITEALRGMDMPVLVKNPVNPDLNLWIGALERVNRAGIRKLAAIHRGFYFFARTPYRNAPMWEIPIELKRRFPELPVFVDPSHICGSRDRIREISQKALDLDMCGLMIEAHHDPDHAWSDAAQQLTPAALESMIRSLTLRTEKGSPAFEGNLEALRSEIDKLDAELLDILARRMEVVSDIGRYKKENDITILQLKRWSNIIRERLEDGNQLGLDEHFLRQVLEMVHKESIRIQNRIMNEE